jgi:hypothetical protein
LSTSSPGTLACRTIIFSAITRETDFVWRVKWRYIAMRLLGSHQVANLLAVTESLGGEFPVEQQSVHGRIEDSLRGLL